MNKYLEKIAGFGNQVGKAVNFGRKVIGTEAKQLRRDAEAVARHAALGHSPKHVERMARYAEQQTRKARAIAGVSTAAVAGGGFLGIHKYHQHKDRAIMERLNNMYVDPTGSN